MRKVLIIALGLASFWLAVGAALAERPRGPNCIAGYKQCKADAKGSNVAIDACVGTFNQCVKDNKDQHYNPYGYPNRIGSSPAVLNNVSGVSVGKASAAFGAKTGTVATTTINAGAVGPLAINPGNSVTTTTNAAPLSAPGKSSAAVSSGVTSHAPIAQPGRSNFRAQ
jgi:type IV secretory pathway TrbL component